MIERDREWATLRAVELYYYDGLTQAAISERLGCTRWTVGRLLKEAQQAGIVEINVHHNMARRQDLEQELEDRFRLTHARVVPNGMTPRETLGALAKAGSDFLVDIRPRPQVVGLAYGRTIGAVARAIPDNWNRGATAVQVSAAPPQINDVMVGSSVRLVGRRAGGPARTLPATPVFDTAEELQEAAAEESTADSLRLASRADVIFYSPEAVNLDTFLLGSSSITPKEVKEILSEGTAIVGNRIISRSGQIAHPQVDSRTLGLSLPQLQAGKLSVAVGAGSAKWVAFEAVLAADLANVLVIDSKTAEYLLSRTE